MRSVLAAVAAGVFLAGALPLASCDKREPIKPAPKTSEQSVFGKTADGKAVNLYTLRNAHGIEVKLIDYGATITSIRTPDRQGQAKEITLGYDSLEPYLVGGPYFGAVVGRYGNRIAHGRFTLDGKVVKLATNNGPNHLHGGVKGFDKQVWTGAPFADAHGPGVRFTYVSADGEEGYPGEVTAHVAYQLGDDDALTITYDATTTKPTTVNLTNHTYFNLSGDVQRDILGEELRINADRFTPVDATLIPTGKLQPVEGTPFDFRKATAVGARIDEKNDQLKNGLGYDHNFVLNQAKPGEMTEAAELFDPQSGRVLTIRTTEPGVQFYSGNFLDGTLKSRGATFAHRSGLALETQHFPDSPNEPSFPSTIVRPGETYRSQTAFVFSTR